jgi:hypothetical protein
MIRGLGKIMALACSAAVLFLCSNLALTGTSGGASQTINAKVTVSDSVVCVAAEGADTRRLSMRVFSGNYLPYEKTGFTDSITADAAALPPWRAPSQGSFSFLITAAPSGCATLLQDITLKPGVRDTVRCKLGPCRDLAGALLAGDSGAYAGRQDVRFALSVFGSPFAAVSDSSAGFVMKNMPYGRYTIRVRSLSKRIMISTIDYPVTVDSLVGRKQVHFMLP